jgi:hypothetical protein
MPITPKRMPEAELERLGDLLERRAVAHGGMDLELLDGFLSALALAPEREPPAAEEWFAHVWGKTEPRWESAADRADAVGLAEALLGDLLARFGYGGDDPQGPMPMASMGEDGAEPGADARPSRRWWPSRWSGSPRWPARRRRPSPRPTPARVPPRCATTSAWPSSRSCPTCCTRCSSSASSA